MANRRMFSRGITSSGRFLRLSCQARALYYDLGMEADDDGFAEAFTRLSATGAQEKQLLELEEKGFITILDPEDLVIHINGWRKTTSSAGTATPPAGTWPASPSTRRWK